LKYSQNTAEAKSLLTDPAGQNAKASDNIKNKVPAYQLEPIIIEANEALKVEEVRVDMADMRVESKPVELLTSVGSCVAICMHDSIHKCGGLAHIMLPSSALGVHEPLPSKFADTAVPALAAQIRRLTGKETRLTAKIAGGANMFANLTVNELDIGKKNVIAVKDALAKHRIKLVGEDVGGSHGRRIKFNVASGVTIVRRHDGVVKKL
jgi:chemotaxis protein CheD